MAEVTITEALAELKVIDKRVQKKREFISQHALRAEAMRDPLEKEGGSELAIQRELQAIRDLDERKVFIRRSIQMANEATVVTVGGQSRSIAEWLVWRRDVAPGLAQFLRGIATGIDQNRKESLKRGVKLVDSDAAGSGDIIVNINEQALSQQIEDLEAVLGTLDGQLSLKNATVPVDIG